MAKTLEIQLEGFEKLSKQFTPSAVRRGANSAINKIGKKARTAGVKKTREKYNIKAGALKKNVKLRSSNPSTLVAVISISGRKFNVANYSKTTQTAAGIKYSVIRGKQKLEPGAFMIHVDDIQKGRKKNVTTRKNSYPKQRKIFSPKSRPGKKLAFKRIGASRYPIKQVVESSAPEMLEDTGLKETEAIIDKELDDLVIREIEFFQDKL